jgi:uncharacterized protein YdeI (YjbR/CyaY-like superfamily)
MNPKVAAYLRGAKKWRQEMGALRDILLGCGLTEELKWGKPCYTFQDGNVVILLPLKEYCALLFCKGALLKDALGLLIKPGENTQAVRQMRFTHAREIAGRKTILKAYVQQAIEVEKSGRDVIYKKTADFKIPEELQKKWDENPTFKTAFQALTPGRQRGYLLYFSAAKQSQTRQARIEKYRTQILNGEGLNDRARRENKSAA